MCDATNSLNKLTRQDYKYMFQSCVYYTVYGLRGPLLRIDTLVCNTAIAILFTHVCTNIQVLQFCLIQLLQTPLSSSHYDFCTFYHYARSSCPRPQPIYILIQTSSHPGSDPVINVCSHIIKTNRQLAYLTDLVGLCNKDPQQEQRLLKANERVQQGWH